MAAWASAVTISTEKEILSARIPCVLLSSAESTESAGSCECMPKNSLSACLIALQAPSEVWS